MYSDLLQTSSLKSNELQYRTEELKKSLIVWRKILLPLNNLFEWEHKYIPLIILGILTSIFILIHQINPPVLTLISCLVLIYVLIDLLGSVGIGMVYRNEEWTSMNEAKYSKLCERISRLEQCIKQQYQTALKMRQESPNMYLIIGCIFLGFIALCSQRIDNLLLAYLTTLIICLIPGVCNQQIITNLWNNNNNKPKTQ